jgi:hypothetical protein
MCGGCGTQLRAPGRGPTGPCPQIIVEKRRALPDGRRKAGASATGRPGRYPWTSDVQLATELAAQQPVPPATPYRLPGPAASPMGGMCMSSLDLMTLPFESLTRALDSTLRAGGTALTGIQVSNVSSRRSRAGSRRSEFRTSARGSVANQMWVTSISRDEERFVTLMNKHWGEPGTWKNARCTITRTCRLRCCQPVASPASQRITAVGSTATRLTT